MTECTLIDGSNDWVVPQGVEKESNSLERFSIPHATHKVPEEEEERAWATIPSCLE